MDQRPRVCALVASRNRPDLVDAMVSRLRAATALPIDFVVVECGTEPAKLSRHSTLWYADDDFRGKCYGHALALAEARQRARTTGRPYDYYWVLMNDVVFEDGVDAASILVEQMEREPRLAILSPTNADGGYPGADRRPGGGWRPVTTCDYLGFMMRAEAAHEVGFLEPVFRYCWGAIHELSFRLYSAGWCVGYSDAVSYRHLGGTTYGAPGTNTISREEYQARARRFAHEYFLANHGERWSQRFLAATRGHAIEVDTFALHRELWSEGAWRADAPEARADERELGLLPPDALAPDGRERVRLHLGCGRDHRPGWVNVDANPAVRPDVVAKADDLSAFADGSVDVIEANHLFEHLMHHEALAALAEWRRVLRPDGELFLELPDFEACLRILGRYADDRGCDLGLTGIYGWLPDIEQDGLWQQHKWGWTRAALARALSEAGFGQVDFGPITQDWRPAAKVGRDVRVRARVAAAAARPAARPAGAPAAGTPSGGGDEVGLAVFAWPDYGNPTELQYLFGEFARHLAGRGALVLRFDPRLDGARERAVEALDRACASVLGDQPVDLVLVDHELDDAGWRRLADLVGASVVLPSSKDASRRHAIARLRAPLVSRWSDLAARAA